MKPVFAVASAARRGPTVSHCFLLLESGNYCFSHERPLQFDGLMMMSALSALSARGVAV
jgi:hypothetical protein